MVLVLTFSFPYPIAEAHSFYKFVEQYEQLDEIKKNEVNEIITNLNEEIEKLGVNPPHIQVHEILSTLDENQKEEVKKVIQDLEAGIISIEEADTKLEQLGIPIKKRQCKILEGLDHETKEKVKEIMREKKNGTITHDEAKGKLKELGVEMPRHEIDDETKEQIKQLVEEAKSEFKQLGIGFPSSKYKYLTE